MVKTSSFLSERDLWRTGNHDNARAELKEHQASRCRPAAFDAELKMSSASGAEDAADGDLGKGGDNGSD